MFTATGRRLLVVIVVVEATVLTEDRRLKQLEEENRNLIQLVAELSLDQQILQDVMSKEL